MCWFKDVRFCRVRLSKSVKRAVEGRVKGKLLALVQNMGPDTGSRQLLKVSYRECQGDIHVHCLSTRRCSELRGETSRNGGPQLMTLQLTEVSTGGVAAGLVPCRKENYLYKLKDNTENT